MTVTWLGYLLGLGGMWLFCDGIISIRLYFKVASEDGKRLQNWKYDHSIRLIRILIAICMMVAGGMLLR